MVHHSPHHSLLYANPMTKLQLPFIFLYLYHFTCLLPGVCRYLSLQLLIWVKYSKFRDVVSLFHLYFKIVSVLQNCMRIKTLCRGNGGE